MNTERDTATRNASVIKRYVSAISGVASGALLTGSNAWGAGYAVTQTSDIDLLIVARDMCELEAVIERLLSEGLLKDSERARFGLFKRLYEGGAAEQFSTIAACDGAPVSIDFLTIDTLRKVAALARMGSRTLGSAQVRFIREFRINPPKALGYSLDDLCSPGKLLYHPAFTEVRDGSGEVRGYLAETAVDATEGEGSYFIGVMSFFFSVAPRVLFDRDGELVRAIAAIRSSIRSALSGRPVVNVTRKERMSEGTFREVVACFNGDGVRLIRPDDWAKFRDIRLAGLRTDPHAFGGNLTDEASRPEAEWRKRLASADRFFLAVEEGGKFVSVAGAKQIDAAAWMLVAVHTLPSARGRGLAQRVVAEVVRECQRRGAKRVELMVNVDQKDAVHVYEKAGFKVVRTIQGERMGDGELHDEFVMELLI